VVNALADATLSVQVESDSTATVESGASWSETYEPNPGASIALTTGSDPKTRLYSEDRPTKTFLSHVIYTLVAVETADGPGVLVIATPLIGSSSVSGGDDLTPGGAIEATIAGDTGSGGYVQRDHFLTLDFDSVFTATVEAAEGSMLDPFVRIIDVRTGALLAWNDDEADDTLTATVQTVFLPAGTYAISVSGYAFGSAGDYVLRTRAAQ
jgi:hypothetical protein